MSKIWRIKKQFRSQDFFDDFIFPLPPTAAIVSFYSCTMPTLPREEENSSGSKNLIESFITIFVYFFAGSGIAAVTIAHFTIPSELHSLSEKIKEEGFMS